MNSKLLILLLPILLIGLNLSAQFPVMDTNPTKIKWLKIETPHFDILMPEGYNENGQKVANLLELIYEPVSSGLGKQPRKITMVLQNQQAFSNGFVALEPRRSELFNTPPQDYNFLGTNQWINLLAVHEFRHVVQYEKSLTGINKAFYYLFGQSSQALWSDFAVPDWFWEGDAVGIETALTPSGRGRIPEFNRLFRVNIMERDGFDYSKQSLGSFKHQVPDHYRLGYFMTTHVRNQYGQNAWADITDKAWKLPIIPFTFSNALKKVTGNNLKHTFRNMVSELQVLWGNQVADLKETKVVLLNKSPKSAYTSYLYPHLLSTGEILVLKTGIGDIAQFIKIDQDGNESLVYTPGIMTDGAMISVQNNRIAWNEYLFDPRWGAKSFSAIKIYDIKSKKLLTFGRRSRYTAASLSPDGTKVATVLVTAQNQYILMILDVSTGDIIRRFENPENHFYSMPRWSDDGQKIVALQTSDEGKSVISVEVETGQSDELLGPSHENIGYPIMQGHWLFYNSPYNGIDNIYALNLESQVKFQVTSRKYGAYNPQISPDNKVLYFNDFQKDGFDVVSMPVDTNSWVPLDFVTDRNIRYYEKLVEQEGHPDLLSQVGDEKYPVSKYNKGEGFFNVHTWGPELSSSSSTGTIGIQMRDVLNNVNTFMGYDYDVNEKRGMGRFAFSFQGWYPIIDLEYKFGNRSTFENVPIDSINTIEEYNFQWKENTLELGFRLPFNLTRSKYLSNLMIGSAYQLTKVKEFNQNLRFFDQISNGSLRALQHRIVYNRQFKQSKRDIRSKWGQSFFMHFQHTPLGGDFDGQYLATQLSLLLPGFFKHHSLLLRGGYQYQKLIMENNALRPDTYLFPSYFFFPRGYSARTYSDFYHFNINYAFPVIYPDLAIGPLLNVQRIKANLFMDTGYGKIFGSDDGYNSFGIELSGDFNFLRYKQLVDLGVRISYIPEFNDVKYELTIANLGF